MTMQEPEQEKCGTDHYAGCDCNPELGSELKWNSESDEYNQWDDLGQDEKDELIAEFISANTQDQEPS
jgi:hypothetical protein